ncbi:MAG: FGGY family carbohydrate kinase, partial [Mangrovicoccus sp.]
MYLGIDLGTSGARVVLADADGLVLASAEASCAVLRPRPGWSEQDPAEWLNAFRAAISNLQKTHRRELAAVRALSLSGHMHGAVLLDRAGHVLRPCILWNDTRAAAEAAELDAQPEVRRLSGNAVFPGFTAPKLLWLARNEPEIFARLATILLPKDYLSFWMTGRRVTDMSDAAGTSWLDVSARRWSEALVQASGLDLAHMPDLVEGTTVMGILRPELAAELGLPNGVQIVAGGADNAASACGCGALSAGTGFVSLGTSGVLLAA